MNSNRLVQYLIFSVGPVKERNLKNKTSSARQIVLKHSIKKFEKSVKNK